MRLTRKQLLARITQEKEQGKFKGLEHSKILAIKAIVGVEITPEIVAQVNAYTLEPHTADQLYVRKFLFAHNCVDRDRERFPEPLLDDFARTMPGKSFLIGHSRSGPGKGLFFAATCEQLTPERFEELTGEKPKLPAGVTMVKVLWAWMYMLNNDFNKETILNINAGIYRHVSIGFGAADLIAVKGEFNQVLYWEYVPPGEATEGSLVWLGAQPGATAQKGAESNENGFDRSDHEEGEEEMKEFLKMLSLLFGGKAFTEENWLEQVKAAMTESVKTATSVLETKVKELTAKVDELTGKNAELERDAKDGKAYRTHLCDEYARMKAALGDIETTPEAAAGVKTVATGWPIEFLQGEIKVLTARMEKAFPDGQLKPGEKKPTGEAGDGNTGPEGKKSGQNPLIPEDEKEE
ncbi:MAG: hypothetical protein AB1553_01985 [Nitrospirota bacterium]